MEEAKNDVADLPSDEKAPIMKLTRTFGGAQNNLAVRKHSLQGAEYKLNKLNTDIMKVQLWLQDVEKAMLEQNDQYNFEVRSSSSFFSFLLAIPNYLSRLQFMTFPHIVYYVTCNSIILFEIIILVFSLVITNLTL